MGVRERLMAANTAARARLNRLRRKLGQRVLHVVVDEFTLASALIAAGMPEADAADEGKVAAAVERVISEWARKTCSHA
jgi:hypothetical protein